MNLYEQILADITALQANSPHGEHNRLDVQLACFVLPLDTYIVERRPNDTGTKVINTYVDSAGKRTTGTSWASDYTTDFDDAMRFLSKVLPDWWIMEMAEDRTPASRIVDGVKERHEPLGTWHVRLQHVDGGRLTEGKAATPALALCAAIVNVKVGESRGRWASQVAN